MLISIHIFRICAFHSFLFFFNEKKGACILYEIWGAELCAVQKATGLSGDPEQKAELGHSLHLLSQREGERGRGWRVRTPWADRDRIISERERDRGKERVETTATGDRMGSYRE